MALFGRLRFCVWCWQDPTSLLPLILYCESLSCPLWLDTVLPIWLWMSWRSTAIVLLKVCLAFVLIQSPALRSVNKYMLARLELQRVSDIPVQRLLPVRLGGRNFISFLLTKDLHLAEESFSKGSKARWLSYVVWEGTNWTQCYWARWLTRQY